MTLHYLIFLRAFVFLLLAGCFTACEPTTGVVSPEGKVIEADTSPDIMDARLNEQPPPDLDYIFVDKDGRFQSHFPGKPQISRQLVQSENGGNVEYCTFAYDYSITKAYWVSYSEHPSEAVESQDPEEMLRGAMNSLAEKLDGEAKLSDIEWRTCQDRPCLYFKVRAGNFHGTYQLLLVSNRLYQVGIVRDGKYPQDNDVSQFLKGFALVEL